MAVTTVSAASNSTVSHNLNGWYPCSEYTFSDAGSANGHDAQCAVYSAPLCYPGICETPEGVNPEVDVFVKRLPATAGNPDTASNVWLLEGGPGFPSTGYMKTLHSQLEGAVNVYTMDHRGTGRSTLLDCVAAQVTTTGSPFGAEIDPSEVPACAEDLQFKYGDLASFSVTTAATDLATFISKYTNGKSTIVYGVSYGTMFAERLIHLDPPEVTGYVLDGVATTSGAPANEFFYGSNWDINFGEVGDAFLALCDRDSNCKTRFEPTGLNNTLQSLIDRFDNDPNSTCAALVNDTQGLGIPSPSLALRSVLGIALMDSYLRTLIPPVVYRLQRCSPEDLDVLTQFFSSVVANDQAKTQDSAYESTLLYNLIVYSEMWQSPLPSMAEMMARITGAKMSSGGGIYEVGPQYCSFSKEKSKSCDEFNVGNYDTNGIVYKRDQYWNKTATIPNHVSVLLMSGKLDPQTPNKYAESLLNTLNGENKELIVFDYASHGTIMTTQMVAGDPMSETCGMKVFASYVRNGGDLARTDKSCIDEMPAFNLTTPDFYLTDFLGTDDAYDGVFNSSLFSSS
ncbi:Serine protease family S33 [Phytophthora palmivora]|uniref:Serine protease family S33 n=1 Tax=Phytophthora palmivora TaxID=4796 RepID=A0A2P4WW15_9STRA|nr:Serine protease family S33 [Phytophthora palmivora]